MIFFSLGIILVLIATLVYLNIQFYKERENFKLNLYVLKGLILQNSKAQSEQKEKLKLSEELEKRKMGSTIFFKSNLKKLIY